MPEGDAVRRLAGTITELFAGSVVQASSPQGRFASSAHRIDGRVVQRVHVHGKHMFIAFVPPEVCEQDPHGTVQPEEWMHIHLGLYGWWRFNGDETVVDEGNGVAHRVPPVPSGEWNGHSETRWGAGFGQAPAGTWVPPEPQGQVRFRMWNSHAVADLIGPNRAELITDAQRAQIEARLGPDPLYIGARDDAQAAARFAQVAHSRRSPIGQLIMDQSIIAGVGNIYCADALFLAGISPYRKGCNVSLKRLTALWVLVCDLMNRGLAAGRLETMNPQEAPDPPIPGDEEASRWYVYHRTGRPCLRCGTPIREALMQGRRLFWCPSCQK